MSTTARQWDAVPKNWGAAKYLFSGTRFYITWRLTSGEAIMSLFPPVIVWIVLSVLGLAAKPLPFTVIGLPYAPFPMLGLMVLSSIAISTLHLWSPHTDLSETVIGWFSPKRFVVHKS